MKKWKNYKSDITKQKFDAIIIGSGIGGLCTAALLSLKGKRVLVLEKHFKIGGWTHTFRRNNYEWDVGIHYIGQVHKTRSPVRRLFDLISDGKLEWSYMDKNYDRIIFPDMSYDFVAPREKFVEDMIDYFPKEERAIISYMNLLDQVSNNSRSYFANKALPGILGAISYPFMTRKFFSFSDRTTFDVLSGLTRDQQLIGVLSGQWGDHGLPPKKSSFAMHAMVARHYLDGGNYPTGSSRRIAETISDLIEKKEGVLTVNAPVSRIKIENGSAVGVIMENGDEIEAETVISNAGVVNTIEKLLDDENSHTRIKENFQKN
jgi:all-trans-retinol 13,14-reductase